jgi:KDO2-lipid IV(A) lauroyltransferase
MTSLPYYLLFGITWLISLLPFWVLYRLSDLLFFISYYTLGYRKSTVISNLRSSFPEKDNKEVIILTKAFYRHFCDFMVEYIKCISMSVSTLQKRFAYCNMELIQDLEQSNKNYVLVTAHYNNWEWLVLFPALIVSHFLVVYRPLHNKTIDRLTNYMRSRFKPLMVPMANIYREVVKHQYENIPFSIYFLADQRPPKTSRFWTKFLNHEVSFYEGVEKISRRFKLAIVFMEIRKSGRGYYKVYFKKLFNDASETKENEITLACVHEMEKVIINKPEFWLWSHKRFKHTRPEDVKLITS